MTRSESMQYLSIINYLVCSSLHQLAIGVFPIHRGCRGLNRGLGRVVSLLPATTVLFNA